MTQKVWNWLVWSSVDPDKVSATVTGAITAVASVVVFIGAHFGISIAPIEVTNLAALLGAATGSILTAFGLIRKIVMWVETKVNPVPPPTGPVPMSSPTGPVVPMV